MLDAFLQVVKHLILLANERRNVDRALFSDHIEPIYTKLREVVEDYREVFGEIRRKLEGKETTVQDIIENLAQRRRRLALVREELRQYADAVIESRVSKKVEPFCWACLGLVSSEPSSDAPEGEPKKGLSLSVGLLNDMQFYHEREPRDPIHRSDYIDLVNRYLQRAESAWGEVMTEYFALRTSLLR
jgi:hypothetical protein